MILSMIVRSFELQFKAIKPFNPSEMKKDSMEINESIKSKILEIKGLQVMLDRDLADLYQTDTRILKQAVNRNIEKFPEDFMFELNDADIEFLVSQFVIPSRSFLGGARPYVFTELGVAMLSSVIKTDIAVRTSIKIIRVFVETRRMIAATGNLFNRISTVEKKQIIHDRNFEKIFTAMESKELLPAQGIFFEGQVFDAHKFISDIIRKARQSIVLIDNYVDDNSLQLFTKRKPGTRLIIYTQKITRQLEIDAEKFNHQYGPVFIKKLMRNHDRFLITDHQEMYHLGASLKDLGKKMFGFSKMNAEAIKMLVKLKEENKW